MLFGLFGAIVVVVAAIGLFSVVSYLVTQRTHELGVRIALGAQRGQVLGLIVGGALRIASGGRRASIRYWRSGPIEVGGAISAGCAGGHHMLVMSPPHSQR